MWTVFQVERQKVCLILKDYTILDEGYKLWKSPVTFSRGCDDYQLVVSNTSRKTKKVLAKKHVYHDWSTYPPLTYPPEIRPY